MSRRFAIALMLTAPFLVAAHAAVARGGQPQPPRTRPRIRSGHYASADGRVTLDVDVPGRRALFHFTLLCRDPFLDQYVTPGPRPRSIHLPGNRVGTYVRGNGEYDGPSESGFPGEQLSYWGLRGHFAAPDLFRGRVGFETGTFPTPPPGSTPPPLARPECLGEVGISLRLEP